MTTLSKAARSRIARSGQELEIALNEVLDLAIENGPKSPTLAEEAILRKALGERLAGFGPLQSLLEDPAIEEIWINDEQQVFISKSGVTEVIALAIPNSVIQTLVEKMLRNSGRRLDRATPFVDASLEDGSRLHVVIPTITKSNWSINIRKFPKQILSLQRLVEIGSLSSNQAQFLARQVQLKNNILVSGATQAGKTTLLCALLDEIANQERIISIEETFEIRSNAKDWVAMQTRQPNLEGVGEVSLRRLVKEALRMRPDRIVVGEVREAESFDLLIALNSGLPGMCTIHANSANDAISKLCTLPLLAGSNIRSDFVNPTVASCIDIVVHTSLHPSGKRSVTEIAQVGWNQTLGRPELKRCKLE